VVDCPGERPVRENLPPGVGRGCWRRAARFWLCTPRRGTAGPGSSTISRTAPAPYFIRSRSGVEKAACREGWSVNWGGPPAAGGWLIATEAGPGTNTLVGFWTFSG